MTEGHFEVIKPNIEFNFRQKNRFKVTWAMIWVTYDRKGFEKTEEK